MMSFPPRLFLIFGLLLAPLAGHAAEQEFPLERLSPDEAAPLLRQAVNGWEALQQSALGPTWQQMDLTLGQSLKLGQNRFLIVTPSAEGGLELLLVGEELVRTPLPANQQVQAGPVKALLLSTSGSRANMMLAMAEAPPYLIPGESSASPTRITALDDPPRIAVNTPEPQLLLFAERFLQQLDAGAPAAISAEVARTAFPPLARSVGASQTPQISTYTDPTNFNQPVEPARMAASANVTLRVIRGEREAVNELRSALSYDSAGGSASDPRVRVDTGGGGAAVIVGSAGDRWQAALRIAESEGNINIEDEAFVRVALGNSSRFNLSGLGREMSARVGAERVGRDAARLRIDDTRGDWTRLGSVQTVANIRHGQTVLLARNSTQRREESSNGVPILRDIPYVGPVFGSSRRRSESLEYALFVTVELE